MIPCPGMGFFLPERFLQSPPVAYLSDKGSGKAEPLFEIVSSPTLGL